MFGSLCALATLSRAEVKSLVRSGGRQHPPTPPTSPWPCPLVSSAPPQARLPSSPQCVWDPCSWLAQYMTVVVRLCFVRVARAVPAADRLWHVRLGVPRRRCAAVPQVLGSKDFNTLLELAPVAREVVVAFQSAQYSRCLSLLDTLVPALELGASRAPSHPRCRLKCCVKRAIG